MIDNPNSPWWSLGTGHGPPMAPAPAFAPRVVAVLGGTSGVGATTVAIGLAETLARLGQRVALVDADRHRPRVAQRCGLSQEWTLADLWDDEHDIHEVLQRGPGGSLAVAGRPDPRPMPPEAQLALLRQVRSLGRHVETVVLDAGDGTRADQRALAETADAVLVVVTAEAPRLLDGYAVLKLLVRGGFTGRPGVIVNMAPSVAVAQSAIDRVRQCVQRFLERPLAVASWISADPLSASTDRQRLAAEVARWPLPRAAPLAEPVLTSGDVSRLDEVC